MVVDPSLVDPVVDRVRDALRRVRDLAAVQAPLVAPLVDEAIDGILTDVTMLVRFWEQAEADVVDLIQQLPSQSTLDV